MSHGRVLDNVTKEPLTKMLDLKMALDEDLLRLIRGVAAVAAHEIFEAPGVDTKGTPL